MFDYYKKVQIEEHMLYASEIATNCKLYSAKKEVASCVTTCKSHSQLVSAAIKDYIDNNNLEVEAYYYQTSKGLARVYPTTLYWPAICEMRDKAVISGTLKTYKSNSGKSYTFIQGECNEKGHIRIF